MNSLLRILLRVLTLALLSGLAGCAAASGDYGAADDALPGSSRPGHPAENLDTPNRF